MALSGCKNKNRFLSSITGSAYEVLVVCPEKTWKSDAGRALLHLLDTDIPGLPQAEPYTNVSWCTPEEFNSMLKPTRNIILVDVNPTKYTQGSVVLSKDKWATPQAIIRMRAPEDTSFIQLINSRGQEVLDYIMKAERDRDIDYFGSSKNNQMMQKIYKQFGFKMIVPANFNKFKQGKHALWISTGSREARQDLLIYSYPYTSPSQMTEERLLHIRDSVTRAFIPGPVPDSYMGTEYEYDHPIFKEIWVDNKYCAEIRGLWKVYGNTMMGGPFISHTRIDELHRRVITVEGFVYAPSLKKRSYLLQLEALLYTIKLPLVLNEVVVMGEQSKKQK